MNSITKLALVATVSMTLLSCATVSREKTFKPSRMKEVVRMGDLELVGESEVSVSFRTLFGVFRHTDLVNGVEYDAANKSYTTLGTRPLLGCAYARPLRKAFGKVLEQYPDAEYYQVVRVEKKTNRLFLGTESELKALVRAYRFRSASAPCAEREYSLDDIIHMLDEGEGIAGKTITAVNMVNFDVDKSTIKAESHEYLDRLAEVLVRTGAKVEVKGHTDNTGSEAHNRDLSRDRAEAVVEYLVGKGVKRDRLSSSYYGSSQPIATNDTEEGRLRNRRVEFEFKK